MNILTRSGTLLLFALVALCHPSCRKESLNEETTLKNSKAWYLKTIDDENAILLSSTGVRSAVNKSVGWSDARLYALGDGTEIVAAPLTITPLKGKSLTGSSLVLIAHTNGKYGFVIAHHDQPDYFKKTFSNAEIQEIYEAAVSANAGRNKKSDTRSAVKGKIMDAPAPGSECIDWYLQTTVRDSYGNVIDYYETYLYTSCGLDENGGSGGGGGDPREEEVQAFEADYRSRMSQAEIAIYDNMSRSNQLSYLVNAKTATNAAILRFPGMDQGDTKADAFRHAYFSILNVYALGLTMATNLGNAHEALTNQSTLASQMDLFNNDVGRSAYVYYPSDTPYWDRYSNLVYSLITNGSLRYISNGQLKPTNQ